MFGLVRKRGSLVAPGCAAAALIALAACSGTNATPAQPFHQPTAVPTASPSTAPTATAAPSASIAPTTAPTSTAAPTPTASPSPTPSGSPLIVLAPAAGAVGNNGGCPPTAPVSYTFTATETGYTGNLTETQQTGSAAQFTVTPASVPNGGTFTVTDNNPSIATGKWNVVIMDSNGNTATETVTSVICLE